MGKISKLILNISLGETGIRLNKAAKVLEQLTKQKPKYGRASNKAKSFSVRSNVNISCFVTLRNKSARQTLETGLKAKEYSLDFKNFSDNGSFGFGINEHIDLGIKYDFSAGIYGIDFFVVLDRPGYRVARRKRCKSRVGVQHRVTKEQAMDWFRKTYEGLIFAKNK